MKDYYKILGINENASVEEIKKAYRSEAKKYHPDITAFDKEYSRKQMGEISEAYDVLSDPEKKAAYDAALAYRHLQGSMRSTDNDKKRAEAQRRAEDYNEPEGTHEVGGFLWFLTGRFFLIIALILYLGSVAVAISVGSFLVDSWHWNGFIAFIAGIIVLVPMLKIATRILSYIQIWISKKFKSS